MECKTVRVVSPVSEENPLGYIVINESDLTEEHVIFSDEPVKAARKTKKTDD